MDTVIYQDWVLTSNISSPFQFKMRNKRRRTRRRNSDNTGIMNDIHNVGIVIQRERISRYWTLQVLSRKTGVSVDDLSQYERGVILPCTSILEKLTKVFNTDMK